MNLAKEKSRFSINLKWVTPFCALVLAILFLIFIKAIDNHAEHAAQMRMNEHARVVANNLWNFNLEDISDYLALASDSYNYEKLVIKDHRGMAYWEIPKRTFDGFTGYLLTWNLIPKLTLTAPIMYDEIQIGTIQAVWVRTTLYEKAYAFFALLLILEVIHLYIRILMEKETLEESVRRRTRELEQSNEALRQEITIRSQVEEALRESEKKHRFLAENINDIIWTADLNLNYTYISPVATQVHGWTEDEFKTLTIYDLLTPESIDIAFKEFVKQLKIGEESGKYIPYVTLLLEMKTKAGTTIWCEITASFIMNDDNRPVGIMGVTRNVSERIKSQREKEILEKQLDRSRKMESLGLLAGGVAHDLNNVLSGIVSYPEILLLDLNEKDPMYKPIMIIRDSGIKASAIVEDLLTLARRGVVAKDPLNLNDIVTEYLASPEYEKMLSYHSRVKVQSNLDPNLPIIKGSLHSIKKCVMNLVSNAAEAQPNGGSITIATDCRYVEKPLSGHYAVNEGEYIVLSVSDQGEGISETDMQRIFEPFYTKKVMGRSGTGLGLAVVWGTVQDHKGYINLKSVVNQGTDFELYFPLVRGIQPESRKNVTVESMMGKQERILVVDDVKDQREIASRMLTRLNYRVHTVESGEKALEYLKDNTVDVVVLDMIMDPGMDGLDTFKQILAMKPGQKTVIVSGYSETDRVKEALLLGVSDYIKKPYLLETIGTALIRTLNGLTQNKS